MTTPISKQEVFNALTSCIKDRWKLNADDPDGYDSNAADCALCELFYERAGFRPSTYPCEPCPVYMNNGGLGCSTGSTYDKWALSVPPEDTQQRAVDMLAELQTIQRRYFGNSVEHEGDWTPEEDDEPEYANAVQAAAGGLTQTPL
jgi:hypothetical protein